MTDIYLCVALMVALSVAGFAWPLRRMRTAPAWVQRTVAVSALGAFCVYTFGVLDTTATARLMPLANAVVLADWAPIALAIFLGASWDSLPRPLAVRVALVAAIASAGLYLSYGFLIDPPVSCDNTWEDGVCIQTTEMSCSAAAAATLLRHHGIPATEGEMAELCLTRRLGTPQLGVYRGLTLKTEGTPWRVATVVGTPDDLRARGDAPAILFVGLGLAGSADPRYEKEWGWRRGLRHSVVLLGFNVTGKVIVGDPSIGREPWSEEALEVLWKGQGLRLVPREN